MQNEKMKNRVYLYPETEEMKARWKAAADEKFMSLSKYLVYVIEDALEEDSQNEEFNKVKFEMAQKMDENKKLKQEIIRLNKVLSQQEEEIRRFQNKSFLDVDFDGARRMYFNLIDLLRNSEGPVPMEDIITGMNIEFNDSDSIKALSKQLEILNDANLIQYAGNAWRWVG